MANIKVRKNTDGSNSYLIRVFDGYDTHGKQLVKSLTWRPEPGMTAKQIDRALAKISLQFEDKVKSAFAFDGNIKFADYANHWLEIKKGHVALSTYVQYARLVSTINESLGHIRLAKLSPLHLEAFYKNLAEMPCATGKPYSQRRIAAHHTCIRNILAQATKERILDKNIASRDYLDAPKIPKTEPKNMTIEETQKFAKCLLAEEDIRIKTALLILLYSGIRESELAGLEWSDITDTGIKICRNSVYVQGYGTITKTTKNNSSVRSIMLPAEVMKELHKYRVWYLQQRLLNGDRWIDSNRLFIQSDGTAIHPRTFGFWLDKFTTENNLRRITPHCLRHTNITLQIAGGVDVRTVAARAGHSQTSTTLNVYSHVIAEAEEKATVILDNIINPNVAHKQA